MTQDQAGAGRSTTQPLPGYRLGRVIGRGGFATVYQAEQLSLGRQVAVKILLADLATEAHRRRFDRERDILARLGDHPYVVDIHDAGLTPENRPYIVMRLYRAGSLASRLQHEGPLAVAETIDLIGKTASALEDAHALGVLHRDVKPENILLSEAGEPALSDFGISSLAGPTAATHRSTTFVTIAHAAPEVLESQQFSVASDVYALASTAYQLLAGRPAFTGSDMVAMARVISVEPPPVVRPDLPPAVQAVIRQGMAKDPRRRHATPGELARALATAAGGAGGGPSTGPGAGWETTQPLAAPLPTRVAPPVVAPPVVAPPVVAPPVVAPPVPGVGARRSASTAFVAAGAVLVLALGGGGLLAWQRMSAPPGPTAEGGSGPAAPGTAASGPAAGPSSAHTRSGSDPAGPAASTVAALEGVQGAGSGTTLAPYATIETSATSVPTVSFQATTQALAVPQDGGSVKLVDTTTQRVLQTLSTGRPGAVRAVAFSPDGLLLAGGGTPAVVWRMSSPRSPVVLRTDTRTGSSGDPPLAFTPDGARLVTSAHPDPGVQYWDSATGKLLGTSDPGADVRAVQVTPDGSDVVVLTSEQIIVFDMGGPTWSGRPRSTRTMSLTHRSGLIAPLAVSPDGATAAVPAADGVVELWDLVSGTVRDRLQLDRHGVVAPSILGYSPDGKYLLTGTASSVVVWDVASKRISYTLSGDGKLFHSAVFAPDGRTIATVNAAVADRSAQIRLWRVD